MQFTAKLHPSNLRDVNTGAPKVLLTSVQANNEDYRDHCWVEITPPLAKAMRTMRRQKSFIIQFEAEEKTYPCRHGVEIKRTLAGIKTIKVLGRA
jgi:hypothetical protein